MGSEAAYNLSLYYSACRDRDDLKIKLAQEREDRATWLKIQVRATNAYEAQIKTLEADRDSWRRLALSYQSETGAKS